MKPPVIAPRPESVPNPLPSCDERLQAKRHRSNNAPLFADAPPPHPAVLPLNEPTIALLVKVES